MEEKRISPIRKPLPPPPKPPCAYMWKPCSVSTARHPTVDYGNNIRQVAKDEGLADAFDFPGFVPAYIRPLFCLGKGPFRWVALSGDPRRYPHHR